MFKGVGVVKDCSHKPNVCSLQDRGSSSQQIFKLHSIFCNSNNEHPNRKKFVVSRLLSQRYGFLRHCRQLQTLQVNFNFQSVLYRDDYAALVNVIFCIHWLDGLRLLTGYLRQRDCADK